MEIQNENDEGRSKSNAEKLHKTGLKQENETVPFFYQVIFFFCLQLRPKPMLIRAVRLNKNQKTRPMFQKMAQRDGTVKSRLAKP